MPFQVSSPSRSICRTRQSAANRRTECMPRKSIRPNISASMCFSLSPVLSSMFQTRLEGALGRVQQQGTGVIDIEALHLCQAVQNPLFLLHQCRRTGHAGGSRLADGKAFTAELILSHEIVAGCPAGQSAIQPETQGHPRAVDDTAAQDVLDHPLSALQQAGRIAPAAQQLLASNLDAYPLRIGHAAHVIPADFIAQLQTNRRLIPGQVFTFVITGLPGLRGQLTLVQAIEFQLSSCPCSARNDQKGSLPDARKGSMSEPGGTHRGYSTPS